MNRVAAILRPLAVHPDYETPKSADKEGAKEHTVRGVVSGMQLRTTSSTVFRTDDRPCEPHIRCDSEQEKGSEGKEVLKSFHI